MNFTEIKLLQDNLVDDLLAKVISSCLINSISNDLTDKKVKLNIDISINKENFVSKTSKHTNNSDTNKSINSIFEELFDLFK